MAFFTAASFSTAAGQTVLLRETLDDSSGDNLYALATGLDIDNPAVEQTSVAEFQGTATVDVKFGFDYANGLVGQGFFGGLGEPNGPFPASIPEAPNTMPGDTPRTGLFLAANTSFAASDVADVSVMPLDPTADSSLPKSERLLRVTGDYDVQVDIWANFETSSASSTEFIGLLVGQDGVSPGRASGGGFIYSLDAGAASDYRLVKPEPGQSIFTSGYGRQIIDGPAQGETIPPDDSPEFDQQYNPEILKAYIEDVQYDAASGVGAASDNENDFWQDAFTTRDYGVAQEPNASFDTSTFPFTAIGQGGTQTGVPTGGNPPGDLGFRWATIRMEVRPDEEGYGVGREESRFSDDLGVARVFVKAAWQGIDETGAPLEDEEGNPITVESPELFVGTIDNSIARGRDTDPDTEVIDFSDAVGLLMFDAFASFNGSGFNFGIFDNLIITSLDATGGLDGDYNGDTVVDAADYTVWRDNLGTDAVLPNDPTGGTIGTAQYDTWKSNFGATAGLITSTAVPEPSSAGLLGIWFLAAAFGWRRRSAK